MAQNYTLGRGKIYFAPFAANTQNPLGERYIGNTPEFSLTIEQEKLDHYSSDQGIREKDDSIALQVNRSGSLTTDNIDMDNIALFFFGSTSDVAVTGATVTNEAIVVHKDRYYQLGQAVSATGRVKLDLHSTGPDVKIVVTNTAGTTTYVEGTDYTIDMDSGRLYIVPTGAITDGQTVHVDYKYKTSTLKRVTSGSAPIEGALRYIEANPKGADKMWYMPWVSITPNGDFNQKGDEFQTIPFSIEVLKKTGVEAIYVDGEAVVA